MAQFNVMISTTAHIDLGGGVGREELKNLFVKEDGLDVNDWGLRLRVEREEAEGTYDILLPWHSVAGVIELDEG